MSRRCGEDEGVKASLFYRTASVLLLIFAVLHTFGFRQVDPQWGVDALIATMRSIHFDLMGTSRSYWELFVGFGLFFSVYLLFAAVVAWQLAAMPPQGLAAMRGTAWALVVCQAAVTIVCLKYAFIVPLIFSTLILVCVTVAAWLSLRVAGASRGR